MFGKRDNDVKPIAKVLTNSTNVTFMAEDCEIKGTIVSKGNARIDGKIEGNINIAGDLVIGQTAVVRANIEGQTISIAGEVRGNVKARELLELSSTARLFGDINVKELKIDQGARFVGSSTYEDNSAKNVFHAVAPIDEDEKNESEEQE